MIPAGLLYLGQNCPHKGCRWHIKLLVRNLALVKADLDRLNARVEAHEFKAHGVLPSALVRGVDDESS